MKFRNTFVRPHDIMGNSHFVDRDGEQWISEPSRFGHDITTFMLVNSEDYSKSFLEPVYRLCKSFLQDADVDIVRRGIGAFMATHGDEEITEDVVVEVLTKNVSFMCSRDQRSYYKPLAFMTCALHLYLESL